MRDIQNRKGEVVWLNLFGLKGFKSIRASKVILDHKFVLSILILDESTFHIRSHFVRFSNTIRIVKYTYKPTVLSS